MRGPQDAKKRMRTRNSGSGKSERMGEMCRDEIRSCGVALTRGGGAALSSRSLEVSFLIATSKAYTHTHTHAQLGFTATNFRLLADRFGRANITSWKRPPPLDGRRVFRAAAIRRSLCLYNVSFNV